MPVMEVTVLTFGGTIDEFPGLIQITDGIVNNGARRIVLDLHGLPFINSAALGYLVKVHKSLAADGGELALARLQPAIENILRMTQLDQLFPHFPTRDEAIVYMGGDPTRPVGEEEELGASLTRRHWRAQTVRDAEA